MTLAEALALAHGGQQNVQFDAGGQTFVLPPGMQGSPVAEDELVTEPPRTVEEALARPLLEGVDEFDVLGQVGGLPSVGRDLFGRDGLFDGPTTSLVHDPRGIDRNLAANIGTGLSVGNTLLGGAPGFGAVPSMAGQGISAYSRTKALDEMLEEYGLSATPSGTAAGDFWNQGFTGWLGAGEPAQAAAARVIGEEMAQFQVPSIRFGNILLDGHPAPGVLSALNQLTPTAENQAALRELGVVTRPTVGDLPEKERPDLTFFERLFGRDLDALAPPPPAFAAPPRATVAVEALANLADTSISPPGAALDLDAALASAVASSPTQDTMLHHGPRTGPGGKGFLSPLGWTNSPDPRRAELRAARTLAPQVAGEHVEAAIAAAEADQAARDQAAVFAAGEGFTGYQGGTGNLGFAGFGDWSEAAFG